jgi:cell division protein FtsB
MREFRKKSKYHSIVYSKLSIVILLFLIVLLVKANWGAYLKERTSREVAEKSRQREGGLTNRFNHLDSNIDFLSKQRGIEEEIRNNLGLGQEGERMILIVNTPEKHEVGKTDKQGFWGWLRTIFD